MIELDIPGWGRRSIQHLVLDFNGCLALDGELLPGVDERLPLLSMRLRLHICTADTFGTAGEQTRRFECALKILTEMTQDQQKVELVRSLGPLHCAAIGNGRNDVLMLGEAALGVAVMGPEGMARELLDTADVLCADINDALDLLLAPKRLTATLRR
jgi:soluble P-type ATPase